jgi:hypothetical protein
MNWVSSCSWPVAPPDMGRRDRCHKTEAAESFGIANGERIADAHSDPSRAQTDDLLGVAASVVVILKVLPLV